MNCKFSMAEDLGYSNYTVEGAAYHCLKQDPIWPLDTESKPLDVDLALQYHSCKHFCKGDQLALDVDREDLESMVANLDPEQKEAWEAYSF